MSATSTLTDALVFLKGSFRDLANVGALLPTSQFLAREITHLLGTPRGRYDILEVGPGTGNVTAEIVRRMGADDTLTLYEKNELFTRHLEEKFRRDPLFAARREKTRIVPRPVQSIRGDERYDYIVMGIPLDILEPGTVAEIMYKLLGCLKPGGTFCYYEFAVGDVRRTMLTGEKLKRRMRRAGVLRTLQKHYEFKREQVLLNLPPLHVHYLHRAIA